MTLLCPRLHPPLPIDLDPSRHRRRRDLHLPARRPHDPNPTPKHPHHLHHTPKHPHHHLHHTPKHPHHHQDLTPKHTHHHQDLTPKNPHHHHHHHHHHYHPHSTPESAESLFLGLLARASLCRKHARPLTSSHRPSTSTQSLRSARFSTSSRRPDATHVSAVDVSDPPSDNTLIPREQLRSIVDQYDYAAYQEEPPPDRDAHSPPKRTRLAQPRKPHRDPLPAETRNQQRAIEYLTTLLADELTPHNLIVNAYKALPSPGVAYLPNHLIRKLFHHFMVVEFATERSMLRYLALVDDMFAADIPMDRMEWNSAIHFAGRYVRKVTDLQVETATQIWLRMEREAKIPSNGVTFNILFDIAIRAGKFALAEVVMKEMVQRDLKPNRYFRTNKILYYGLKGDGDGVRAAYKELVDSGTLVDTAVLNCVITSLIKAGEASAAEFIFSRMKTMNAEKQSTQAKNISDWRGRRDLGKVLARAAEILHDNPEQRAAVQDATPISPDLHTYRILIRHHALESGNIDRVSELLNELSELELQIQGSIFFQLFRGFKLHGGIRYSSWNKAKLDQLWMLFCSYVDRNRLDRKDLKSEWVSEEDRGCYFDVPVVIVVLQAYYRVTGKETTLHMWEEMVEMWNPDQRDLESVNTSLANLFA